MIYIIVVKTLTAIHEQRVKADNPALAVAKVMRWRDYRNGVIKPISVEVYPPNPA